MDDLNHILKTIEILPEPVLLIDSSATILSCNQLFTKMISREKSEIMDQNISIILPHEISVDLFMQPLLQPNSRKFLSFQSKIQDQKGVHIPVYYTVSVISELGGEKSCFLLIANRGKVDFDQALEDIFEEIPIPFLRISEDGVILNANEESWILLTYWQREVNQSVPDEFLELLSQQPDARIGNEFELQIGFKDFLFVTVTVSQKGYIDIFAFDITLRKRAEKKLEFNAQVFESAFEGIMITDAEKRILDVNNAFCQITGYEREEVLGEDVKMLQSGKHSPEFYEEFWQTVNEKGSWQGEIWDRKKNGEIFPKWLSINSIKDEEGEVIRYIGLFSDISSIKETEEKLYHIANHDALTGLVNRRFFMDQLERSLLQAKRMQEMLAVMFIDLDGFKQVNDSLGHQSGDELLCIVARRLKECVREADIVARMGGDEFTILFPRITISQNIVKIAEKILKALNEPMFLKSTDYFISASIGIAIYPDDATDADSLVQKADLALYQSKNMGKNTYQFFSTDMNRYAERKFQIQSKLHHAMKRKEFQVYYQPQFDVIEKRIVGVEALLRWIQGDDIVVSPERFIPIAEDTGIINDIGEFVLETVCRQGQIWREQNLLDFPISVNVSAIQLQRQDFVSRFNRIVSESKFPPSLLELELTEQTLIENAIVTQSKLRQFKNSGCTLVIDDFGVKYSSLSYLKLLPLDKFKIDKLFIRDIPEDNKSMDIVRAIVAMGKSLNLQMVAEGVETAEQVAFLKAIGCRKIQGYFISPAIPTDQFQQMLESYRAEELKWM